MRLRGWKSGRRQSALSSATSALRSRNGWLGSSSLIEDTFGRDRVEPPLSLLPSSARHTLAAHGESYDQYRPQRFAGGDPENVFCMNKNIAPQESGDS